VISDESFQCVPGIQHPELSETDMAALQRMRKMLPAMDDLISSLAGEVLCGGGGGCGGLA
jgi:hypothetical protein